MISGATIKAKRNSANIAGHILSRKLGFARSKLTAIERGYVTPSPDDLIRIETALDELIRTKVALERIAADLGWPVTEVP
jgi:transcriptional regulator with XRE-family HTH domain